MRITDALTVTPYAHQAAFMRAPILYPDRDYFFMVAGYNAGKSFCIVLIMITLAVMYNGNPITVGIGGGTMKLLSRTTLASFRRLAVMLGLGYDYNKNDSIITIGTTEFIVIATEDPDRIYAYNFSIFLGDELDELPQEKALEVFKAVQERTRVPLPETVYRNQQDELIHVPGRSAYSMFLSTAQGYRGTYQIVEEIKERGDPYLMIHAQSEDNLSIDKTWLARMRSLYTEVEALVYLDGQFANLTTGRVYYDYNEELHKAKTALFEVQPTDVIHVGQDLNAGFSRGTAVVVRSNVIYAVKNWSFGEIGHAPKMIRNDFPQNEIHWYPDATGKEIITGYLAEIREAGLSLWLGTINPNVVDRIFFVNKLFKTKRCVLFPACRPLSMALKVRQFDEHGNPEKGKGPTAPDHYCDGFEYVIWRMVISNVAFRDLVMATRAGRGNLLKEKGAA